MTGAIPICRRVAFATIVAAVAAGACFVPAPGWAQRRPAVRIVTRSGKPGPLPAGAIRRFGESAFHGPSGRFSFSPNGKLLAAGSGHRVDILDVATGQLVRRFDGHSGFVNAVAFAADGKTLFVGDGTSTYWDVKSGRKVGRRGKTQLGLRVAVVSADRKWVAAICRDGRIRVAGWNTAFPKQSVPATRHSRVLAISRHGELFAVDHRADGKYRIRVWDRRTLNLVREFPAHSRAIGGLAFSPDAKTLYSGGHDGTIMAWDLTKLKQGPPIRESKPTSRWTPVMSLAVSPDGKTLAAGISRNELLFIEVATRKVRRRIGGFISYVSCMEFSPDGKLITASGRGFEIPLFDTATGKPRHKTTGHLSGIVDTAVSRDGKVLATLGRAGDVCLWNLADGRLIHRSRGVFRLQGSMHSNYGRIRFLPDGRRIAVLRGGRRVLLWDSRMDAVVGSIPAGVGDAVAAASPQGFFARALPGGMIEVPSAQFRRNVAAQQRPLRLAGHRGDVTAMAVSRDGSTLVSAGVDKTLRVWRLKDGFPAKSFDVKSAVRSLVFSPDGKRVAAAAGGRVQVRELSSGKRLAGIQTALKSVRALAFSTDGKRLATAGTGRTIEVWDAATGKRLYRIRGEDADLHALSFSPDGKRLAAGGADKTIRVFDIATGDAKAVLSGHLVGVSVLRFVSKEQLASGSRGGEVFLWDASKSKQPPPRTDAGRDTHPAPTRKWQLRYGIADIMVSPVNGYVMAVAGGAELVRFDPTNAADRGRMIIMSPGDKVRQFRISPDGRHMAVASANGVRLFDVSHGKEVAAMQGAHPVFSSDGKRLYMSLSASRGGFVAWDLTKSEKAFTIPAETTGRSRVVAEFPGGTMFLSQSIFGRVIQVWDAKTQRPVHTLSFKPAARTAVTLTEGRISAGPRKQGVALRQLTLSPDGWFIAGVRFPGTLELRELLTGKVVFRLPKMHARTASFSFVDDETLIAGTDDGTAIAWSLRPPGLDPVKLVQKADRKELNRIWRDLQSEDGPTAYRAFHSFVLLGKTAVTFLRDKLKPAAGTPIDRKQIDALIAKLEDARSRARKSASEQLRQLGDAAVPALRAALQGKLKASTRIRIKLLLAARPVSGDVDYRAIRAVHVLQRIGSGKAKELLADLAKGNSSARTTQEARTALKALSRRSQ